MNSGMRRITARLAATTLVGVVALSGTTAAQAWTLGTKLGTATVGPVNGTDADTPVINTPGTCDQPGATNSQLEMYGPGFPAEGYEVSANNDNTILPPSSSGGYSVSLIDNLANIALAQPTPVVYSGSYTIAFVCKHSFGVADLGDYIATLNFADPHHYTSGAPVAVATTTSLTANPAGTATTGSAVTLTAAVTPAGAAGSVQFLDGSTALGTATVNGTTAALTTTALAAGSHSFTAVFTPTAPVGATPSTSAAVSYTVTAPTPAPAVTHASAFVLPVGTKLTCPGGAIASVPASAGMGNTFSCSAGGAYVFVGEGAAPQALVAPSLNGSGKVGTKLVLKPGLWSPSFSSRTVVWKRDGKVIAKQSGGFYVVKKTDKGHKISALVTVHLVGHEDGTAATTAFKAKAGRSVATLLERLTTASAPQAGSGVSPVLGVPVGSEIGCVKGEFSGATTTTANWLLDGQAYPADLAFKVPAAILGHQLVCRTTATGPGGTTTSDAVVAIGIGAKLLPYIAPKIAGTAKVGKKLTAVAGKWYPGSTKAAFVWLRNGKAIKGATKATYIPTAADKKHKISVRVTALAPGYATGTAVSAAVSVG